MSATGPRPEGLCGNKRVSDHSFSNDTMKNKRSRAVVKLEDFTHVNQLILQAAAIILDVSLDRLLSLAYLPPLPSGNQSSDSLDTSSNSSSEHTGHHSPPGYSDTERQALDFALSSQRAPQFTQPAEIVRGIRAPDLMVMD
jgi:hypothetical protein